jgi:aspartyl-tRNA(Asn)/glutamyl-tRNA(Gln) amidotransferase subunit C
VPVSIDDVRYVAGLARLGVDEARATAIAAELNTILDHMHVLSGIDTTGVEPMSAVGTSSAPLRPDSGPPIPLMRPPSSFAPKLEDGFFLVPRLATHEDPATS